jgi:hypothetical protein
MLNLSSTFKEIEFSYANKTVFIIEIFCKYRDLDKDFRENEISKFFDVVQNLKNNKTKDINFHLSNIDYFAKISDLLSNYNFYNQYKDYKPKWNSNAWYYPKSVSSDKEICISALEKLFRTHIEYTNSFPTIENTSVENLKINFNLYEKYRYNHITFPKFSSIFSNSISDSYSSMKIGIQYVKEYILSSKEIEKLELFIKVLSSMRSDRDFFKLLLQDIDDNQSTLNSMNLIMEDISKSIR